MLVGRYIMFCKNENLDQFGSDFLVIAGLAFLQKY